VYDPLSKDTLSMNRMKVAKLGFAKASDFTMQKKQTNEVVKAPESSHLPLTMTSAVQAIVEADKPKVKVPITDEIKRKIKQQRKEAEVKYQEYMSNRVSRKKFMTSSEIHKVESKETNFMKEKFGVDVKENIKPNTIVMEE